MNTILWIAQILLAGAFMFSGFSKILVFKRQKAAAQIPFESGCVGMPNELAAAIALFEIVGAIGLVIPVDLWPPNVLVILAASCLALVAIIVGIFQARQHEHTTPIATMFVLAVFVIVGRWPIQTSLH